MSASKAIIDRILADAKSNAEQIISDAKSKAKAISMKSQAEAASYKAEQIKIANDAYDEIEKRKVTVANLEVRKVLLEAKQSVISSVFEAALVEIRNINPTEYKNLITRMLSNNASDEDTVIICKDDEKVITQSYIEKIAKQMKINITLSKAYGSFSGGIILENKNYDKNLTLDVELEAARDTLEREVAQVLFGE